MRKQTKLVAVLSAAALLAIGASMTSFAAGWQKSDDGTWQYFDRDDEMVTGDWQKDGAKWFYLDDDGNMLTDSWVDDTYYVREDGSMIVNDWKKATADEDVTDPDEDGEFWYYFGSKGKKTGVDGAESKKIGAKTYYFDVDGKMLDGWQRVEDEFYYLGSEDEGWRATGWLWLEAPEKDDDIAGHDDGDKDDACDEEGWYHFGSSGKMDKEAKKKKINGKYYFFNEHGQMLYEWINDVRTEVQGTPPNAQADGENPGATPSNMQYLNGIEEGWRADGWYEIDGSEDTKTENDTDWYYFKDGSAKKASLSDYVTTDEDGAEVLRARLKANNSKYFCFNQYGQMKTGLQYSSGEGFYYFDANGYMKTGKISNVEEDNESFTYSFNTKTGKNGLAIDGVKDGYLYFNGKRLEADDDNRLYVVKGKVYLVNKSGKIQKSKTEKTYDVENDGINATDKVKVKFDGDTVESVGDLKVTDLLNTVIKEGEIDYDDKGAVTIPMIELYDDVFTYKNVDFDSVGWLGLNEK